MCETLCVTLKRLCLKGGMKSPTMQDLSTRLAALIACSSVQGSGPLACNMGAWNWVSVIACKQARLTPPSLPADLFKEVVPLLS